MQALTRYQLRAQSEFWLSGTGAGARPDNGDSCPEVDSECRARFRPRLFMTLRAVIWRTVGAAARIDFSYPGAQHLLCLRLIDMRADQRPERKGDLLVFLLATVGAIFREVFPLDHVGNSFLSAP